MKNDLTPIVVELPRGLEYINIYHITDLHIGAASTLEGHWYKFQKHLLEDPHAFITCGGDLSNNATRTSKSNPYEETMRPSQQKEWLKDQLRPIHEANKLLCIIPGNHEGRSSKDVDDHMLYDVADCIGATDLYRPNAAFLKISLGNNASGKRVTYMGTVVHGNAGGLLTGTAINKTENFGRVIDGIDFLFSGHVHKGAITKPAKLVFDPYNNKVTLKPFVNLVGTSWTAYADYALKGLMYPAANDRQILQLSGTEKRLTVIW